MRKAEDLSGKCYGQLLVICRDLGFKGNPKFFCVCSCGEVKSVFASALRSGDTRSCGCLRKSLLTVHGKCDHKLYTTWAKMHDRCKNNTKYYEDVTVCERWNSFENFLQDMGDKPTDQHTLDRIDPGGDYTPDNCRWATKVEQARNTRDYKGKGVVWCEGKGYFRVQIGVDGTTKYVGVRTDFEEAVKLRKEAEALYWN